MDIYTVRNKLNIGVPITEIPLRVTYYSRVSTDHLEQKKSLQNQKEHFDEYIKNINSNIQKWTDTNEVEIVDCYDIEEVSGNVENIVKNYKNILGTSGIKETSKIFK